MVKHRPIIIRVNGRSMREHRYLMEQHLGRRLLASEHVYFLNGVQNDNRIENLGIMSAREHLKLINADPLLKARKARLTREARAKKYWSTKKVAI